MRSNISFVSDVDTAWGKARFADWFKLDRRFAVIQHRFVEAPADDRLDDLLWLRLVGFIVRAYPHGEITALERESDIGPGEEALIDYLDRRSAINPMDWDPPDVILVREAESVVFAMITERWFLGGGPWPYADSMTYSMHSRRDLGDEILAHLSAIAPTRNWIIEKPVITAANFPGPR